MTGSSENKFYCADVRSNMSVCPSVSLSPVYLIYPSIHPPTYLHIHASIHPSVRSHDEKRKEKMRIVGKSNMRKRCRGLCGVEATAQKLRESVKRHSEFRGVLHNNFNIYRPNTYHIVLNTVIYDYCLPERDNMQPDRNMQTLRRNILSPFSRCPEEGDSWSVRRSAAFLKTVRGASQKTVAFRFG